MKLNAPRKITWYVALVLAVLGLIGLLVTVPVLTPLGPWLELLAAVLLLLATWLEGL